MKLNPITQNEMPSFIDGENNIIGSIIVYGETMFGKVSHIFNTDLFYNDYN